MIFPNSRDLLFIHDCIVSNPILELLLRKLCCNFCEDREIFSSQKYLIKEIYSYVVSQFFCQIAVP